MYIGELFSSTWTASLKFVKPEHSSFGVHPQIWPFLVLLVLWRVPCSFFREIYSFPSREVWSDESRWDCWWNGACTTWPSSKCTLVWPSKLILNPSPFVFEKHISMFLYKSELCYLGPCWYCGREHENDWELASCNGLCMPNLLKVWWAT